MDRYSGRDSDFQEDVPRNKMSTFVSSGVAPSEPQGYGKVEVQVSKREQHLQRAAEAGTRPAVAAQRAGAAVAAPVWVGHPPKGTVLRVYKDKALIESIPLDRPMTVFGRGQAADVVLDHQSISRQHAAVCYQRMTGKWLVMDLRSVHGTFYEGKPVSQSQPAELREKGQLRFGGSSRVYMLDARDVSAARVPPDAERQERTAGEEARSVGPMMDNTPGKFADLLQEPTILDSGRSVSSQEPKQRKKSAAKSPPSSRRAPIQPLKSGLYDHLPPPEHVVKLEGT